MKKQVIIHIIIVSIITIAFAGCSSGKRSAGKVLEEAKFNSKLHDSLLKKQSAGVDFFAQGDHPIKWKVEMDHDRSFNFLSSDGTQLTVLPVKPVSTASLTSYSSGEMKINMYKEACANGKQGKIEVIVKGKTYTGCGQYLYDYRLSDSWELENINGNDLAASMFNKGLPVFNINLEQKTITGTDGCNNISAGLEILGSKLRFSPIISTKMACRNDLFASILGKQFSGKTVDYFIRDGKLIFYLEDDSMVRFRKKG